MQLQGWQEKGLFGAYFPDNGRWRHVWKWLMSQPAAIWEFTHPNGAPWASPLVFEDSSESSRTGSTDNRPKGSGKEPAIDLSIQVSALQFGQLRAAKQTSVLVNDVERMNLTSQRDPENQELAVLCEVHPQRSFKKDAGLHFGSIPAEGKTERTLLRYLEE